MDGEILYDLQVNHQRYNPVMVLGHGRSGTSILIKLLRKYLKINFGTESQFIVRYYNKLTHYGDLKNRSNLKNLVSDISKERYFKRLKKRFNFEVHLQDVLHRIQGSTYRSVLNAFFEQFADYHGMRRWGDKTPEYLYHLPVLCNLFPDAQYIHIVRDGRDVALSEFKAPFGAKNIFCAAHEWQKKIKMVHDFAETIPVSNFYEIRYEELLAEPVNVFTGLISFLGIDDTDGRLQEFIKQNIAYDLKRDNSNKWKKQLTSRQKRLFERVAGSMLRHYGYEAGNLYKTGYNPMEGLYWRLNNQIKKRLNHLYWKDTRYRLSNRMKSNIQPLRKWILQS